MQQQQQQPQQWTPQLVEDLVARQFLHNQDVSNARPPAPLAPRSVNNNGATGANGKATLTPFSDATKQYMKFFNQQPAAGSSAPTTPPPQQQMPMASSPSTTAQQQQQQQKAMMATASPSSRYQQQQQPQQFTVPTPQLPSPQSRAAQQQQQQQGFNATPAATPTNHHQQQMVGGASPTTQQQLNNLQQIQQQLTATNSNNNTMMNSANIIGSAASRANQTDCVAQCKPIGSRIEFPANIPSNAALTARPDPNDPKRSLCPSAQLTVARIMAQQKIDADLIFGQPTEEFPLTKIFAAYPDALKTIAAARGESGDWRSDTFTKAEEATYKREMRYEVIGPYQARPNNAF